MKTIRAEYIESGTFVAGEEDCFDAEMDHKEEVVIIKKEDWNKLRKFLSSLPFDYNEFVQ